MSSRQSKWHREGTEYIHVKSLGTRSLFGFAESLLLLTHRIVAKDLLKGQLVKRASYTFVSSECCILCKNLLKMRVVKSIYLPSIGILTVTTSFNNMVNARNQ